MYAYIMTNEQGKRIEMDNYNRKRCRKQASKQNQQIDCHLIYLPGLCTWTAYRIRLAGKKRNKNPLSFQHQSRSANIARATLVGQDNGNAW